MSKKFYICIQFKNNKNKNIMETIFDKTEMNEMKEKKKSKLEIMNEEINCDISIHNPTFKEFIKQFRDDSSFLTKRHRDDDYLTTVYNNLGDEKYVHSIINKIIDDCLFDDDVRRSEGKLDFNVKTVKKVIIRNIKDFINRKYIVCIRKDLNIEKLNLPYKVEKQLINFRYKKILMDIIPNYIDEIMDSEDFIYLFDTIETSLILNTERHLLSNKECFIFSNKVYGELTKVNKLQMKVDELEGNEINQELVLFQKEIDQLKIVCDRRIVLAEPKIGKLNFVHPDDRTITQIRLKY